MASATDPSIRATELASPEEAAEAFAAIEAECDALSPGELVSINVDVPTAVQIVLGARARCAPMRDAIVALPSFEAKQFDKLRVYALGAWFAHLLTLPPASADGPTRELLAEAVPMRERLLSNADVLADEGLLDAKQVAAIRSGQGYADIAGDLVAVSAVLRAAWPAIEGKTPVTLAQLDGAQKLGTALMDALGVKRQPGGET